MEGKAEDSSSGSNQDRGDLVRRTANPASTQR